MRLNAIEQEEEDQEVKEETEHDILQKRYQMLVHRMQSCSVTSAHTLAQFSQSSFSYATTMCELIEVKMKLGFRNWKYRRWSARKSGLEIIMNRIMSGNKFEMKPETEKTVVDREQKRVNQLLYEEYKRSKSRSTFIEWKNEHEENCEECGPKKINEFRSHQLLAAMEKRRKEEKNLAADPAAAPAVNDLVGGKCRNHMSRSQEKQIRKSENESRNTRKVFPCATSQDVLKNFLVLGDWPGGGAYHLPGIGLRFLTKLLRRLLIAKFPDQVFSIKEYRSSLMCSACRDPEKLATCGPAMMRVELSMKKVVKKIEKKVKTANFFNNNKKKENQKNEKEEKGAEDDENIFGGAAAGAGAASSSSSSSKKTTWDGKIPLCLYYLTHEGCKKQQNGEVCNFRHSDALCPIHRIKECSCCGIIRNRDKQALENLIMRLREILNSRKLRQQQQEEPPQQPQPQPQQEQQPQPQEPQEEQEQDQKPQQEQQEEQEQDQQEQELPQQPQQPPQPQPQPQQYVYDFFASPPYMQRPSADDRKKSVAKKKEMKKEKNENIKLIKAANKKRKINNKQQQQKQQQKENEVDSDSDSDSDETSSCCSSAADILEEQKNIHDDCADHILRDLDKAGGTSNEEEDDGEQDEEENDQQQNHQSRAQRQQQQQYEQISIYVESGPVTVKNKETCFKWLDQTDNRRNEIFQQQMLQYQHHFLQQRPMAPSPGPNDCHFCVSHGLNPPEEISPFCCNRRCNMHCGKSSCPGNRCLDPCFNENPKTGGVLTRIPVGGGGAGASSSSQRRTGAASQKQQRAPFCDLCGRPGFNNGEPPSKSCEFSRCFFHCYNNCRCLSRRGGGGGGGPSGGGGGGGGGGNHNNNSSSSSSSKPSSNNNNNNNNNKKGGNNNNNNKGGNNNSSRPPHGTTTATTSTTTISSPENQHRIASQNEIDRAGKISPFSNGTSSSTLPVIDDKQISKYLYYKKQHGGGAGASVIRVGKAVSLQKNQNNKNKNNKENNGVGDGSSKTLNTSMIRRHECHTCKTSLQENGWIVRPASTVYFCSDKCVDEDKEKNKKLRPESRIILVRAPPSDPPPAPVEPDPPPADLPDPPLALKQKFLQFIDMLASVFI